MQEIIHNDLKEMYMNLDISLWSVDNALAYRVLVLLGTTIKIWGNC